MESKAEQLAEERYPKEKEGVPFLCDSSDISMFQRAAFIAGYEADKWISVEDELPDYGVKVLVRGEQKGMNPQMGGAYTFITDRRNLKGTSLEKQIDRLLDENHFHANYVTHWQPLPSPPKTK
jgi:hypothetical protein